MKSLSPLFSPWQLLFGLAVLGFFVVVGLKSLVRDAVSVQSSSSSVTVMHSSASGDGPVVVGSGHAATETRAVSGFTSIDTSGSADLDISVGPEFTVSVTTDDNLLPIIETRLEGQNLHIGSKQSYSTNLGVKVKITLPALTAVASAGSGNVQASGLAGKSFRLTVAGSGDATLSGQSDAVDFSIAGSGNINATKLTAKSTKISVAGSGEAHVSATESLNVSVAGSGDVRYSGHPANVQQSVVGSGNVQAE